LEANKERRELSNLLRVLSKKEKRLEDLNIAEGQVLTRQGACC
jgi:hypothetical protein